MKKIVGIMIAVALVIGLAIVLLNRGPAETPDPEAQDRGEQPQQALDNFEGNVWLNAERLELQSLPILDKGIVYLPLHEVATALDISVEFDDANNVITIGENPDAPQERQENLKLYKNNIDLTPSNIITQAGDFYISGREIAPLLNVYIYESLFENAVYLVDDTETPRDGEYVAVKRRDQRGWAPRLNLTISNGRITQAEYGEFNEEGQAKLDDPQYVQNWRNAFPNVDPVALMEQLESQLVEGQRVQDVDVSTGATGSYKSFTELASVILAQARTSRLDQNYVDGAYEVYGNPANNGWTPYIAYEVQNGRITSYLYDEIDQEGNSKRENDAYLNNWRNNFPEVDPIAIIEEREEQILQTQDPNTIDAITGATSWARNMKRLTMGSLIQAQQAELEQNFDDIYVFVGEQNERGDVSQLLITVQNDQMTNVDFSDYRNGVNKKFDEPYLQNWRNNFPEVDQLALVNEMEQTFLETEDPDALDGITGATAWRNAFQNLARRALDVLNINNN